MESNDLSSSPSLVGFDADALCRLKLCPFSLSSKRRGNWNWSILQSVLTVKWRKHDDSSLRHLQKDPRKISLKVYERIFIDNVTRIKPAHSSYNAHRLIKHFYLGHNISSLSFSCRPRDAAYFILESCL